MSYAMSWVPVTPVAEASWHVLVRAGSQNSTHFIPLDAITHHRLIETRIARPWSCSGWNRFVQPRSRASSPLRRQQLERALWIFSSLNCSARPHVTSDVDCTREMIFWEMKNLPLQTGHTGTVRFSRMSIREFQSWRKAKSCPRPSRTERLFNEINFRCLGNFSKKLPAWLFLSKMM